MANGLLITPAHVEAVLKCDTISDFHNHLKEKNAFVPSNTIKLKETEPKVIKQKVTIKNNIEFKNFVKQKLISETRVLRDPRLPLIKKLNANRAICSKPAILSGSLITEKGKITDDVLNSKTTSDPEKPESSVMKRLSEIEHGRRGEEEITYQKIEEIAKSMMKKSLKRSVVEKYGSVLDDPLETMRMMRLLRLKKKPFYNNVPIFAHFKEIANFEKELLDQGIFF
ncbi:unnamed protein product [Nezara viridula]|uniref:Uncharacterized protein n=1 Tax=Nezara viridula TaxID=85310 RepID=A0A9P0HMW0_NEZVI|nr:unnamed protein product [Nezara viridula]